MGISMCSLMDNLQMNQVLVGTSLSKCIVPATVVNQLTLVHTMLALLIAQLTLYNKSLNMKKAWLAMMLKRYFWVVLVKVVYFHTICNSQSLTMPLVELWF